MRPLRNAVLAAALLPWAALAQDTGPAPVAPETRTLPPPIIVIDQNALFEQSAFGRAAKVRLEEASRALAAENREIEAALEVEERTLTEQRATLPADQFRKMAEAFNVKVEGIRKAQDAKSRSIARARDEDRQRFLAETRPVLAQILRDSGGVVLLDRSQVVLSLERIDITAEAVRRMDAVIGTGNLSPAPPGPPPPEPPP